MNRFSLTDSFFKTLFLSVIIFFYYTLAFAQADMPTSSLTVSTTQAIGFGTFCITGSAGGTITVGYDGNRTCTGDIILLPAGSSATPAIVEAKLCPGKNFSINFDVSTTISASKGVLLKMDIGPTEKGPNGYIFTTNTDCNAVTYLRVGGTLHIPGNAMPGNYSGMFNVTLKQE